jgi:Rap1a immunity proteins
MKAYAPLLCLIIWTAPCFAQTKQSAPLSIQPETKQSAPLSIQPGTTMLTLNKMCQENANTRSYAVCMAYLRGLFDGMQQAKIVEDTKSTFCPPQTPDLAQIRLIIEQWVRDNPKNAGVSVGWAGPLALSLAFPCR